MYIAILHVLIEDPHAAPPTTSEIILGNSKLDSVPQKRKWFQKEIKKRDQIQKFAMIFPQCVKNNNDNNIRKLKRYRHSLNYTTEPRVKWPAFRICKMDENRRALWTPEDFLN